MITSENVSAGCWDVEVAFKLIWTGVVSNDKKRVVSKSSKQWQVLASTRESWSTSDPHGSHFHKGVQNWAKTQMDMTGPKEAFAFVPESWAGSCCIPRSDANLTSKGVVFWVHSMGKLSTRFFPILFVGFLAQWIQFLSLSETLSRAAAAPTSK